MAIKRKPLRSHREILVEAIEARTLFTSYTASLIAPVPARTDTNFNAADATLVRNPTTGILYGFDNVGGTSEVGTIYQADPVTKIVTTITTFNTTSGPELPVQLGIDSDGNLFGISQYSAASGATAGGTLFELPAGNFANPIVLYTFPAAEFPATPDGTEPLQMIVDSSNNIDILTGFGGAQNGGDVVQFQPGENYATPNLLGTMPQDYHAAVDNFTLAPNGTFFGTTAYGGANSEGTVWELPAGASVATNIASFDPTTTGSGPTGELYADAQGDVFGVVGGTGGSLGGVWEYTASTQQLSIIAPFADAADPGSDPSDGLIADSTGNLYGTTAQGDDGGTIFEMDATTHALTFSNVASTTLGTEPLGVPTPDGAGNFYITTTFGAANNAGAVVEVSPGTTTGGGGGGSGGGTTEAGTLSPVIGKSTIPTSVVSGAKVTGTVKITINNTGTTLSQAKDVTLFACPDGVIDSSSIQLTNLPKSFKLKAAKSTALTVSVKTLDLPAGTYTILAETTDITGAVTESTTGPVVTVAAPFVSIASAVGAVTPSVIKLGSTGTFKVTLTNSGNIASTGSATIAIGLSTDGATLAIPISTMKFSPDLKVEKPQIVTLHVKIPKTFTATGSYFPFITFTQGTTTFDAVGTALFTIA